MFRKYLWFLLRERQFDGPAVEDMVLLKGALALRDDEVGDLLCVCCVAVGWWRGAADACVRRSATQRQAQRTQPGGHSANTITHCPPYPSTHPTTITQVAEALKERAQRIYDKYGTLMLNTEGMTPEGVERKAACRCACSGVCGACEARRGGLAAAVATGCAARTTSRVAPAASPPTTHHPAHRALFSKLLFLTEHEPLVAAGSEAFRVADLRTVSGGSGTAPHSACCQLSPVVACGLWHTRTPPLLLPPPGHHITHKQHTDLWCD